MAKAARERIEVWFEWQSNIESHKWIGYDEPTFVFGGPWVTSTISQAQKEKIDWLQEAEYPFEVTILNGGRVRILTF